MTTPTTGVWTYRETAWTQGDLTGYKVEARDGDIGKADKASNDVGSAFIVVDAGPWIFGKKVMIPAGIVRDIDPDTQTVFVDRTKDEIKNSPSSTRTCTTIRRTATGSAATTARPAGEVCLRPTTPPTGRGRRIPS